MARKPLTTLPIDEGTPGEPRGMSPIAEFLLEEMAPVGAQAQTTFSPTTQFLLEEFAPVAPPAQPQALQKPSVLGEFGQGVAAGTQRLGPLVTGAGATVAGIFGADEVALEMLNFAQETEEEISRAHPVSVTFDEAFASPSNFARFALRNLGEQVPVVASIILGGGVGGLVGRLVGRGALSAAEGAQGLSRFGIALGAGAAGTTIETGATAQELFEATGEMKPAASFAAGIAKGALEAVVPLAFARRFGLGAGETKGILDKAIKVLDDIPTRKGRIAAGFAGGGVIEGATEFLQEAVDVGVRDYVDENFDALSPETRSRLLESAFVGALVGSIFGGIGGAVGGKPSAQEREIEGQLPRGEERAGETGATPHAEVTPAAPVDAEGNLIEPELPLDVVPTTPDVGVDEVTGAPTPIDVDLPPTTGRTGVTTDIETEIGGDIEVEAVRDITTLPVEELTDDELSSAHAILQLNSQETILHEVEQDRFEELQAEVTVRATLAKELQAEVAKPRTPTSGVTDHLTFINSVIRTAQGKLGGPLPTSTKLADLTLPRIEEFVAENSKIVEFLPNTTKANKRKILSGLKIIFDATAGNIPIKELQRAVQRVVSNGLVLKVSDIQLEETIKFKPASPRDVNLFVRNMDIASQTDHDVRKHKPGTARGLQAQGQEIGKGFFSLTAKGMKSFKNYVAAATDMLNQFGLNEEKLVVGVDGLNVELTETKLEGYESGSVLALTPNTSFTLIQASVLNRGDPLEIATILAHEFGHLLTWRKFTNAHPGVQLKIIRAFERQQRKALLGSLADFNTALRSPDSFDFFMELAPGEQSALTVSRLNSDPEYWFGFSEFLAEQVAKWYTTTSKPLTQLDKFFKGLSKALKQLYRTLAINFKLSKEDFKADADVVNWIESLTGSKAVGGPESLHANVEASLAETVNVGVPDGEMQVRMEKNIDTYVPSASRRKEIKEGVARINWLQKWGYTLRQLTQRNPHITGLTRYNELMDAWSNEATVWKGRADETIKYWRALSKKSQDQLAKFIFEIDAMEYLGKDEEARLPTDKELLALAEKHRLTEEAYEVYQLVRSDLNAFIDKVQEIAERDIKRTITNPLIQQVRLAEAKSEFDNLRNRPYFPHSRFGDFSVVVKNKSGATAHFEQFKTRIEAQAAFEEINAEFPQEEGFSTRIDKIPEEMKPFRGLPPTLLQQLKTMPGLSEQQSIWIEQLMVELSPTKSFRKRLSRRQDIPGFSLDAMRSYANYFWHGSNYLARIEFQQPLQEAIDSVHAEASDPQLQAGKDVTKLREIADFMQNHFDQILNPGPDWAQLRSLAFIWWLGFLPQSAAVNLTQIPMVTLPYLGSRFGDVKAVSALKKAYGDFQRIYRMKTDNVSDEYLEALSRAIEKGVVDESYAAELAATAEGGNLAALLPGSSQHRFLAQVAHWSAFLFQSTEKINRRVTFGAAWELARNDPENSTLQELKNLNKLEFSELLQEGFSETDALAYLAARDAVWSTQFQYSNHARPRFIRGRKGVIFTFFTFLQNMVHFAAHDRARTRFFLMMFMMAGLMGLPGADDLNSFVRFASRKLLGEDVNIEKEVRRMIVDMAGDNIDPDLILHGTSRVGFGMHAAADLVGIPFPEFDLSASLGMGRIIPGFKEAFGTQSTSFDANFARISTDIAGASLGIGINIWQALSDDELPFNDWKRWERAMPRAMKSLVRANRYLEEGRERNRQGATFLDFDASDPDQLAEIVGQAMGFTPTRLTRKWDRQRMEQEAVAFWSIRRGMILRQVNHARTVGDKQAVKDVMSAVKRYNNEVAIPGFKISSKELRQSQRERARQRALFELGRSKTRRAVPLVKDVQRLFPEVEQVEDFSRKR